ncbi:MAG TPA: fibrobacter succinogenes major paralogous domain-containing protein [Lacibacter sp.]|nr:fibrobacter succinogenes major paralogous domain-containing protein [Lacibacter sp.]HMO90001.1 fibrobacter succinogenes major paralogous domain-containing protein [Lacibacter sp.]
MKRLIPLLLLLAVWGCRKTDFQSSVPQEPLPSFRVDTANVSPSTIQMLYTDKAVQQDSFLVQFGPLVVPLVRMDSMRFALLVPMLPAGTYYLKLKAAGATDSIALTIQPYSPIPEPAAFMGQLQQDLVRLTDSLAATAVPGTLGSAELNFLRQLQQSLQRNLASLTPDQQAALALYASRLLFDRMALSSFTADTTYQWLHLAPHSDPAVWLENEVRAAQFTAAVLSGFTENTRHLARFWSVIPQGIHGAAYQLTLSLLTYQKLKLGQQLLRAGSVAGMAEDAFVSADGTGTNAQPLVAVRNRTATQRFQARFRTLTAADGGLFNGLVAEVFAASQQQAAQEPQLNQQWQDLRQKFPAALSEVVSSYPPFQFSFPQQATFKTAAVPAARITVARISHPNISINQGVDPAGNIRLTFSSDTALADGTPFTFDVVYTQPVLQRSVSMTQQAQFQNYANVTIGTQVWMSENLDVAFFRNGDPIPHVPHGPAWATLTTPAWCYYNNDPATGAVYGRMYNWYAVGDPRGLAPEGWHVARDAEWNTLANFVGGTAVAGGQLKAVTLWNAPNTGATNSRGFTALPGGVRGNGGSYFGLGNGGIWWCAEQFGPNGAIFWSLSATSAATSRGGASKQDGHSVRCVKD